MGEQRREASVDEQRRETVYERPGGSHARDDGGGVGAARPAACAGGDGAAQQRRHVGQRRLESGAIRIEHLAAIHQVEQAGVCDSEGDIGPPDRVHRIVRRRGFVQRGAHLNGKPAEA